MKEFEFIKDIFAKWQIPTEKDDVNVQLAICNSNGLLAPKNMPAASLVAAQQLL